MELLERCREFTTGEGGSKFRFSVVVYTDHKDIFIARPPEMIPLDGPMDLGNLNGVRISQQLVYPDFDPQWCSLAPGRDIESNKFHVKTPSLFQYHDGKDEWNRRIRDAFVWEIRLCELVKASPHPHVVKYFGCKVKDGRVVGVCLECCKETLFQRMMRNEAAPLNKDEVLEAIRSGIEHIHSLGYAHNDLHADNVMMTEDDTPVIIDFDFAQPVGSELVWEKDFPMRKQVGNTPTTSQKENDFKRLAEMDCLLDQAQKNNAEAKT